MVLSDVSIKRPVFATVMSLVLIIFGLFVENVIFRTIERRTVRRWGMQT